MIVLLDVRNYIFYEDLSKMVNPLPHGWQNNSYKLSKVHAIINLLADLYHIKAYQ